MQRNTKLFNQIRTFTIITVGLFIHALGWTAFLIPSEIVSGGVGGISAMTFYSLDIPAGYTYLAINSVLIVIAIKMLGASFGIKTIFSVITMSLFLTLQQKFITAPIITDTFMASVLGALLAGTGIGIVLSQGGSTGGTDIIAMIVNKYRNTSPGKVILYCDIVIIGSSYFLFESMEKLVYGFVTMGIVAYTIDLVLNGTKQSIQLMIFSKNHSAIAEKISSEIDRGLTILNGEGWYSKNPMKVIVTIVRRNEAPKVLKIVKSVDPDAFISQGQVMGVYGEGFDEIRG